jgi:hypothetical protein
MLCVVSTVHVEMSSACFLVEPQTRVNGLSVVWPQNHWDSSSVVWPQNHWDGFSQFGLKPSGFGFSGLGLKTSSYGLVIWATKSPRWFLSLGLKTMWATVCQLCHKTDGREMTQGTR